MNYYVNIKQTNLNTRKRTKEEIHIMSIKAQAERAGFQIVGELTRCVGLEPSHLYQWFLDEAENQYILHRGILTIVAADGKVY